jgi:hypothetical protein
MNMIIRLSFIQPHQNTRKFILLFFLGIAPVFSQSLSFFYPFDHWAVRAIRTLGVVYPRSPLHLSEMPYSAEETLQVLKMSTGEKENSLAGYYRRMLLSETYSLHKPSTNKQSIGFQLWNRLDYSDGFQPGDRVKFQSDLLGFADFGRGLSANIDFQFDTNGMSDSDYHGTHEWKGVTADMRSAFFRYHSPRWSLLIGRQGIQWGPGNTGSLLTSGFAPALDMIKLTVDFGSFRFQGFNAILERSNTMEDTSKINRFFSGHRLSYRLPGAEFALTETVMYGGPKEIIHGGYFNPLIPYYFTDVMQSEERQDNISLSMEASFYWPKNVRLYSQYMVDEYYYEGEHYPKRTALLAGFDWVNCCDQEWLSIHSEYARVDRWTYNYEASAPWDRLVYYRAILGHPIGPDGDLLSFETDSYLGRGFLASLILDYSRSGETKIETPLHVKDELNRDHVAFPYGVVQKETSTTFHLEYFPNISWLLNIDFRLQNIKNQGHSLGKNWNRASFYLGFQYFLK